MSGKARPCDYCGQSTALLSCRADSTKLCLSCDREVLSTNQLFSKHTHTLLCDSCDHSPATILCSTESSILCQNCDWETHNPALSSLHDRRPKPQTQSLRFKSPTQLKYVVKVSDWVVLNWSKLGVT
ncbi:hypothetical protein Fmac_027505 [Flemingia macrophylla]|uniref:B box-type domain-containing protein n=1 Tax=Flemingia macrophylla TaxID=520843 RepID=A0ABD1LHX7_9FABA